MRKHAYLIIAHQEFEILELFLKCLDSEYNDFYIHIDKKVENFDFSKFKNICEKSIVEFTDKRINAHWGGKSLIICELELMKKVFKKNYSYVHLCSGVDLPLKNKKEIYDFFEKSHNKQFLELLSQEGYAFERLKYMNLFNDTKYRNKKIIMVMNNIIDHFQNYFQIHNRISKQKIVKTAQWFSLTGEAVDYIYEQRKKIIKMFKHSVCGDELFVGTILYGTDYWKNLYSTEHHKKGNMRFMKWTSDFKNASVLTINNYNEIKSSNCLYGRKFSFNVDKNIILKLYDENTSLQLYK